MEFMENRIFTLSNLISFLRLLMSIPMIFLILGGYRLEAIGLIFLASFSDFADGFIARKYNQISEFGKIIDPLADKVFIGAAIMVLFLTNQLPLWFLLVIICRDILILIGGLFVSIKLKKIIPSDMVGKISVLIIGLALLSITAGLSEDISLIFMILATGACLVSFGYYIIRGVRILKENKI